MVTLESKTVYTCPAHPPPFKVGVLLFSTGSSNSGSTQFHGGTEGGGGTPGNSWWGCAARFSKS